MKIRPGILAYGSIVLLCLAAPATAQYLRITTDNPTDNTRLRASGTTILTLTLDTNHDRSGSLQSCNSHTAANCGSATTTQPLDMFSYTLALKTVGGTVTWGTFTAADAAYTDTSPQIQSNAEVEINKARPVGTVTPAGLATLGTIPVTPASGAPRIDVQIGASAINPFGFGTGFGTSCDGFFFPNTYVVGDPSDPCGAGNGIAGDWFDWDGASAPAQANNAPVLDPIANMTFCAGSTADQAIRATDADADAITFTFTGPTFMSVTSNAQAGTVRTGNIHLAPQVTTTGSFSGSVTASSGSPALSDSKSFVILITGSCGPPVLAQPANMIVPEGGTADQTLNATDPGGSPITFSKVSGPTFMTVTTTNPGTGTATGNIHLAPGFASAGVYNATVRASNGALASDRTLTITVCNGCARAPVLNPIANMTVTQTSTANQTITASDPDGTALTFSKSAGPTFMTVTTTVPGTGTASGNIHLAPGTHDSGTYGGTVSVSDGALSDSKSFTITLVICNCGGPVLAQPANMTVNEGATANQALSATDADGQGLAFSKVIGPTYATVTTTTPGTGTASGNLALAPGFSDAGTATVSISVSDGATSDSKSLTVTVNNVDRPVSLGAINNMTVAAGATADQTFTATDPDGDAITFTNTGPPFMTRMDNIQSGTTRTGNIHLAPNSTYSGTYGASVTAAANGATSTRSFTILVCLGCERAPVLAQPANMTVNEGVTADQTIVGTDPDGNLLTFSKVSGPAYMVVTTTNPGTGTATGNIHLAPGFNDQGTAGATVIVSDGTLSDSKSFTITVLNSGNQCPTANAGGPYSGLAGVPVTFDGTASSDPDGNPLTYAWDFDASDGITIDAVGATPSHLYSVAGSFTVTLTVTDNGNGDPARVCSASATTAATIQAACGATVFNGYDTIRLGSGKPTWFGYIQPTTTCYNNSDVVIASFVMKYAGRQISASGKTAVNGDKSGDGIQEIKISFSKDDLRTLFTGTGLANGHNTVTVTLEASLTTGGRLSGTTQLDVVNNGSFNVAVSPNPLNPQATLVWTTSRAGSARIEMFDIHGRLVRRLVDEPVMAAGAHEATIDGRNQRGERLPSGVYFIRGMLAEGAFREIITILK